MGAIIPRRCNVFDNNATMGRPVNVEGSSIRVLVVYEYEPFRRFVRSTLRKRPALRIVGEASDGVAAVQQAEALNPDLILLDVGLPRLNGLQAAREIRKLFPDSKIIFVSQESSPDVVQEALSLGALGLLSRRRLRPIPFQPKPYWNPSPLAAVIRFQELKIP
jgi:CheY-like chemotaxis protein